VLDTVSEDEIHDIFMKYPILPSSEVFYFVIESDGLLVKQSKLTDFLVTFISFNLPFIT
jgi:hypothetical protein